MKLCFKTFFFCFYVVLSLRFLDASKDSVFLDGNVHDEVDGLLSSDGKHGNEVGSDVELSGSGPINLTLNNGELIFKVCNGCVGKSAVCYESEIGLSDSGAAGKCFESSCKVEIEGETDKITFGGAIFSTGRLTGCITSTMNYKFAIAKSPDQSPEIESCMPKIVGADKMVKLFVDIEDGCSVVVMNAKIHEPPTTTTSPTKMPQPAQSPPKDNSAEASSFPDWGYAVIGIALLIVILFIGFVAYYLYRKRQTSKRIPPNVDRKQPKSTKAKDATIETPTKKDDDVEAAKVEPKKNQKKEKKTKTIEPTITEDISAPTVTQPDSAPSKQLPPPNPAACYPVVKRLIPRSMKSAKTDSLDETLKKGKSVMMESESVIF